MLLQSDHRELVERLAAWQKDTDWHESRSLSNRLLESAVKKKLAYWISQDRLSKQKRSEQRSSYNIRKQEEGLRDNVFGSSGVCKIKPTSHRQGESYKFRLSCTELYTCDAISGVFGSSDDSRLESWLCLGYPSSALLCCPADRNASIGDSALTLDTKHMGWSDELSKLVSRNQEVPSRAQAELLTKQWAISDNQRVPVARDGNKNTQARAGVTDEATKCHYYQSELYAQAVWTWSGLRSQWLHARNQSQVDWFWSRRSPEQ